MSESLKELSRLLIETKLDITKLNKIVSDKKEKRDDFERRLIAAMNANELNKITTDAGTFSISNTIVASKIDWDIFHRWIIDNDALYMLQRRVSGTEYAKLVEMGEEIPGITPFKKITVATRKPANT